MKVYINSQQRICDVYSTIDPNLNELEIPDGLFPPDSTEDLIKCYTCQINEQGIYTIQLLIPSDMAEQINQSGLQRIADQKIIESQLESIVENDQRLSILELGL